MKTLEQIYAKIPAVNCKRLCAEACGPIPMEHAEYVRIFGKPFMGTLFAGKPMIVNPVNGSCPKLSRDGLCRVYDQRPAICRLFGTVYGMACSHGCQPERWLTDDEAHAILREVELFSERLDGRRRGTEPP